MTLLAACLLGIVLTGCNPAVRVTVIDREDIVALKKGQTFIPDRDGCFYSLAAEKSVMEAKRSKLQ